MSDGCKETGNREFAGENLYLQTQPASLSLFDISTLQIQNCNKKQVVMLSYPEIPL
jgi:hypothetical protein